jgi:hypothetical protein
MNKLTVVLAAIAGLELIAFAAVARGIADQAQAAKAGGGAPAAMLVAQADAAMISGTRRKSPRASTLRQAQDRPGSAQTDARQLPSAPASVR